MERQKIYIGKSKGVPIYFDTTEALNKHIVLLGSSGSGKSVETQNIILNLVKHDKTIVILDIHSVFDEDHIFKPYRENLKKYINQIDEYSCGISCDLFAPVKFADGTFEKPTDTAGAIVEIIARTTRMGAKQRNILRKAVLAVMNKNSYGKYGFEAFDYELEQIGTSDAEEVRDKIYTLTVHNIFHSGCSFIQESKINVLRLSKFDFQTQEIISEMVLLYLWRMAVTFSFKKNGLFIFVDEFHNLISGKNCALNQIAAEGRKFNLNLILATQQFPSKAQQTAIGFMQSGLTLLFRPCAEQVNAVAKFIDTDNVKEWAKILKSLGRGEFIAIG